MQNPKTAIFQPRPGLGDLIWHLPVIRAYARQGPVILVAKPSTQADALLAGDPDIARVVRFDRNPRQGRGAHDGPLGFVRLLATLRALKVERCVLLHHGASLAMAVRLAGVSRRAGYGYSRAQRAWLNEGPFLQGEVRFAEAFDQAAAYAAAAGFAGLPEPSLRIDEAARQRMMERLRDLPRPWLALGIGAHGSKRQWAPERFAALAGRQLREQGGCVLLLGGEQEAALAARIAAMVDHAACRALTGWPLPEIVALLAEADEFLGNDSGLMNVRAACGGLAVGLFGASGPLAHSARIVPVVPAGGPRAGMDRITLEDALAGLAQARRGRPLSGGELR